MHPVLWTVATTADGFLALLRCGDLLISLQAFNGTSRCLVSSRLAELAVTTKGTPAQGLSLAISLLLGKLLTLWQVILI